MAPDTRRVQHAVEKFAEGGISQDVASVKLSTFVSVKNKPNIAQLRFVVTETPASRAAFSSRRKVAACVFPDSRKSPEPESVQSCQASCHCYRIAAQRTPLDKSGRSARSCSPGSLRPRRRPMAYRAMIFPNVLRSGVIRNVPATAQARGNRSSLHRKSNGAVLCAEILKCCNNVFRQDAMALPTIGSTIKPALPCRLVRITLSQHRIV